MKDNRLRILLFARVSRRTTLIGAALESAGFAVETMDSRQALRKVLAGGMPELLVMDMPAGSRRQRQYLLEIAGDVSLSALPILALTAANREDEQKHALFLGATEFSSRDGVADHIVQKVLSMTAGSASSACEGGLAGDGVVALCLCDQSAFSKAEVEFEQAGFRVVNALTQEPAGDDLRFDHLRAIVGVVGETHENVMELVRASATSLSLYRPVTVLISPGVVDNFDLARFWRNWANYVDEIVDLSSGWKPVVASVEHLLRNRNEVSETTWRRCCEHNRLLGELLKPGELLTVRDELQAATHRAALGSRAKGEFVTNMSHELRTPVYGIQGLVDLLLSSGLSAQQEDYLEMLRVAADFLLSILNDLLDFSKIEAHKLEIDAIPFSLRDTVGEAVRVLSVMAHSKGLELMNGFDPNLPDRFIGDPLRLKQVILNLLGNAIKFTESGEIVVRVEMGDSTDGQTVVHLRVKDTGAGIAADKQETVFEAFEQADETVHRRFGGTGLGLTITARLLERMGGGISIESELGRGTTFLVSVPLQEADGGLPEWLESESALSGLAAIVLDRHTFTRETLCATLHAWGADCVGAESGECVLDQLELWKVEQSNQERKQVLFLDASVAARLDPDIRMQLQELRDSGALTWVLMLASGSSLDIQLAADLKAHHVLKPLLLRDVANVMSAIEKGEHPGRTRRRKACEEEQTWPDLPLRVLLAEDQVLNRNVVSGMLQAAGCGVTVVEDGQEAVEVYRRSVFDLVLLDVQMPGLDGLSAAARLRDIEERNPNRKRTPIVAMTAGDVVWSEEEAEAGSVDTYIAKPIRKNELISLLIQYSTTGSNQSDIDSSGAVKQVPKDDTHEVIDMSALMDSVRGDVNRIEEMYFIFETDYPKLEKKIERAIELKDAHALASHAHGVKGLLASFFAENAFASVGLLETLAKEESFARANSLLPLLREDIRTFMSEVEKILHQ